MEAESGVGSLDLSHLTEEEQDAILQVLQRDLELRRQDEGRVRMLAQSRADPAQLHSQSGAWFREVTSGRHRGRMSGSDLVRATIRRRTTKITVTDSLGVDLFNGKADDEPSSSSSPEARLRESAEDSPGSPSGLVSAPSRERIATKQHCKRESVSLCILTDLETLPLQPNIPQHSRSSHALGGGKKSLFSSGIIGAVEVCGRVQFSLAYDGHKGELRVKVHRCEGISPVADENRSDPYVKCYLLPDVSSRSKRKTAVKKRTQNPVYEQTLKYKICQNELNGRTLNLSVWHDEPLARNVFLGEVEVALGPWDWTCTQPLWRDLQPRLDLRPDCISSRGTLLFSIKFIPQGLEGEQNKLHLARRRLPERPEDARGEALHQPVVQPHDGVRRLPEQRPGGGLRRARRVAARRLQAARDRRDSTQLRNRGELRRGGQLDGLHGRRSLCVDGHDQKPKPVD
ncbi:synaptotagmin-like protein 1 isoform X2 [Festucalex cinctus]